MGERRTRRKHLQAQQKRRERLTRFRQARRHAGRTGWFKDGASRSRCKIGSDGLMRGISNPDFVRSCYVDLANRSPPRNSGESPLDLQPWAQTNKSDTFDGLRGRDSCFGRALSSACGPIVRAVMTSIRTRHRVLMDCERLRPSGRSINVCCHAVLLPFTLGAPSRFCARAYSLFSSPARCSD